MRQVWKQHRVTFVNALPTAPHTGDLLYHPSTCICTLTPPPPPPTHTAPCLLVEFDNS